VTFELGIIGKVAKHESPRINWTNIAGDANKASETLSQITPSVVRTGRLMDRIKEEQTFLPDRDFQLVSAHISVCWFREGQAPFVPA
jgi:hypothetical protein